MEGTEIKFLAGLREVIRKFGLPMFVDVDKANDAEFQDFVSANDYKVVETGRCDSANRNYAITSCLKSGAP